MYRINPVVSILSGAVLCAVLSGCSGGGAASGEAARPGSIHDSIDGEWPAGYEGSTIPYSGDDPLMTMLERSRERVVRALSALADGTVLPPVCGGAMPGDPLRTLVPTDATESALCRRAVELLAKEVVALNAPDRKTPFKIQQVAFPNGIIAMTKRTLGGEIRFHKGSLEELLDRPRRVDAVVAHEFGHKPDLLAKLGIARGVLEERILDAFASATVLYHDGIDRRLRIFGRDTLLLASDEGAYDAAFGDVNGDGKTDLLLAQGDRTTVVEQDGKILYRAIGDSRVVAAPRLRSSRTSDVAAAGADGLRLFNGDTGAILRQFTSSQVGIVAVDRDGDGIDDVIGHQLGGLTRLQNLANGNGAPFTGGGFRRVFAVDLDRSGAREIIHSSLLSGAYPFTRILSGTGTVLVDRWDYDLTHLHSVGALGIGATFSDGQAAFVPWSAVPGRTVPALLEKLAQARVASKLGTPVDLIPCDLDGDEDPEFVHVFPNRVVVTGLDMETPRFELRYPTDKVFINDIDRDGKLDLVLAGRPPTTATTTAYAADTVLQADWDCLTMNRENFQRSAASMFDAAFTKTVPLLGLHPNAPGGHRLQILMSKEQRLSGATLAVHIVGKGTGRYLEVPGGGVEGNGVRLTCVAGLGGACYGTDFAISASSTKNAEWRLPPEALWGLQEDPAGHELVLQWNYSYGPDSAFELSDVQSRAIRSWNSFFVRWTPAESAVPSPEEGYGKCATPARDQALAAATQLKALTSGNAWRALTYTNVVCVQDADGDRRGFGIVSLATGKSTYGVTTKNGGAPLLSLNGPTFTPPLGNLNYSALSLAEHSCKDVGPDRGFIAEGTCRNPHCWFY